MKCNSRNKSWFKIHVYVSWSEYHTQLKSYTHIPLVHSAGSPVCSACARRATAALVSPRYAPGYSYSVQHGWFGRVHVVPPWALSWVHGSVPGFDLSWEILFIHEHVADGYHNPCMSHSSSQNDSSLNSSFDMCVGLFREVIIPLANHLNLKNEANSWLIFDFFFF